MCMAHKTSGKLVIYEAAYSPYVSLILRVNLDSYVTKSGVLIQDISLCELHIFLMIKDERHAKRTAGAKQIF